MAWFIAGRTQFNLDHLKGVDLEKLIEDYKQIESPENVQAAWEEINGKYKPEKSKKKTPKKAVSEDD